jgi:hypothetical protein
MVSAARPAKSPRFLLTTFGIVVIGVLAAVATDVAVSVLTPVKLAFILGGVALLIPTMVVKDPTAYWLFLLVLSIPFDVSKLLSLWLVDPRTLVDMYGQPASGTTAVELYLTDVVLAAMLAVARANLPETRKAVFPENSIPLCILPCLGPARLIDQCRVILLGDVRIVPTGSVLLVLCVSDQ